MGLEIISPTRSRSMTSTQGVTFGGRYSLNRTFFTGKLRSAPLSAIGSDTRIVPTDS